MRPHCVSFSSAIATTLAQTLSPARSSPVHRAANWIPRACANLRWRASDRRRSGLIDGTGGRKRGKHAAGSANGSATLVRSALEAPKERLGRRLTDKSVAEVLLRQI